MRYKAVTVGIVLAGTALASAALTLGRARGAAWIGQPLELMVPVQLDPSQTDGALCAEADVFHGDSRQESSRVQVQVIPTELPDTFNLKINSSALIDEPVVTVYLRAGCSQKSSRKFVLLADFPNDSAAPASRTATPAAPQVPLVIPVQTAQAPVATAQTAGNVAEAPKAIVKDTKPSTHPSSETAKAKTKESVRSAAKETPREPVAKKEAPAKTEKQVASTKPVAAGKPRLRLDPIETLNERVKTLEATSTGTTAQDELARDNQKMLALQGDLKTLLEQAVKNEASLMAMRERLEKAESERVPVTLVYGLVALVVLCLGALAFLWTRRTKHPIWESSVLPVPLAPGSVTRPDSHAAPLPRRGTDVGLAEMDDASFNQLLAQSESEKKN